MGPVDDGRVKPEVVALGADIYSTVPGSGYQTMSGTSMAAPSVSGAAILLQELYSENTGGECLLSSTMKALFVQTADDILDPGPDYRSGFGMVDAKAAADLILLHVADPTERHITEDILTTEKSVFRFPFVWNGAGEIRATLCWTDPAFIDEDSLNSTEVDARITTLVRDLDMRIVDPSLQTHLPFVLDPENPTVAATRGDNNVDNLEQILITAPEAGTYELVITVDGELTEDQVFSLVLSGNNWTGSLEEAIDDDVSGRWARAELVRNAKFRAGFEDLPSSPLTCTASGAGWIYEPTQNGDGDWLRSGPVPDNGSASFETEVYGPGTVEFAWAVDSEEVHDRLSFSIDGEVQSFISGQVAYGPAGPFSFGPGDHTLRWTYAKDQSFSPGEDSGWVDNILIFGNRMKQGMQSAHETWIQGDSSGPADGTWAATIDLLSGWSYVENQPIGFDETATFSTMVEGPALIGFHWRIHAGDYATLSFRAEGPSGQVAADSLDGRGDALPDFRSKLVQLGAGTHELIWSYRKLIPKSGEEPPTVGSDAGHVTLFFVKPLPATLEQAISLAGIADHDFTRGEHWLPATLDGAPRDSGQRSSESVRIERLGAGDSTLFTVYADGPGLFSWWSRNGMEEGNRFDARIFKVGEGDALFADMDQPPGDWKRSMVDVPSGRHALRFFVVNNGNVTMNDRTVWLDELEFVPDVLHPARGLDYEGVEWNTGGDAMWTTGTGDSDFQFDSFDMASSGQIGFDEVSWLETVIAGPARLIFNWRVRSAPGGGFLSLRRHGVDVLPPISGDVDWSTEEVILPAGENRLRWSFEKVSAKSDASDKGMIDQLTVLPADFGVSEIVSRQDGSKQLKFRAYPGGGYSVQRSSDLRNWFPLAEEVEAPDAGMNEGVVMDMAPGDVAFYRVGLERGWGSIDYRPLDGFRYQYEFDALPNTLDLDFNSVNDFEVGAELKISPQNTLDFDATGNSSASMLTTRFDQSIWREPFLNGDWSVELRFKVLSQAGSTGAAALLLATNEDDQENFWLRLGENDLRITLPDHTIEVISTGNNTTDFHNVRIVRRNNRHYIWRDGKLLNDSLKPGDGFLWVPNSVNSGVVELRRSLSLAGRYFSSSVSGEIEVDYLRLHPGVACGGL